MKNSQYYLESLKTHLDKFSHIIFTTELFKNRRQTSILSYTQFHSRCINKETLTEFRRKMSKPSHCTLQYISFNNSASDAREHRNAYIFYRCPYDCNDSACAESGLRSLYS